jgi:hypothetical protein
MSTQSRRLAIALATALLWSGFGARTPAEAGPVLPTPAGLAPGTHFRFVFVTDGTTNAMSANIMDYDNFVNMQAGGATYNGVTISWQAIGSTSTVNAISHITGTQTDPVYLSDGSLVASSTTTNVNGLWSGVLQHAISEDLLGTPNTNSVWTGTQSNGTGNAPFQLGSAMGQTTGGFANATTASWVAAAGAVGQTNLLSIYGISADLVSVVPEPSSCITLGIGLAVTAVIGWSRHRRDRRRQAAA